MENAPNNLDHKIVDYVIDKYYKSYKLQHYADLYSYGLQALYEANDIFDNTKCNKPFKWFATSLIRRAMFGYIRDRVPKITYDITYTDHTQFLENFNSTPPLNVAHIDLINVLKTLDNKYKSVLYYKYYKGYTYKQIAKILGVSINTPKQRHDKALKIIKEKLWTTN